MLLANLHQDGLANPDITSAGSPDFIHGFFAQVHRVPGHFLILFPRNLLWAPENLNSIAQVLKAVGLIGEVRETFLFNAGPEYLSLVTNLGCSPQIALGENEGATTIRLTGIFDLPQFVYGENLKPPRCPHCRKPQEKKEFSYKPGENLRCCHCGFEGPMPQFDWRRSAAFGRAFIEISNVFESEAVPGEELTDCLLKATGESWDYCYIRRD